MGLINLKVDSHDRTTGLEGGGGLCTPYPVIPSTPPPPSLSLSFCVNISTESSLPNGIRVYGPATCWGGALRQRTSYEVGLWLVRVGCISQHERPQPFPVRSVTVSIRVCQWWRRLCRQVLSLCKPLIDVFIYQPPRLVLRVRKGGWW